MRWNKHLRHIISISIDKNVMLYQRKCICFKYMILSSYKENIWSIETPWFTNVYKSMKSFCIPISYCEKLHGCNVVYVSN